MHVHMKILGSAKKLSNTHPHTKWEKFKCTQKTRSIDLLYSHWCRTQVPRIFLNSCSFCSLNLHAVCAFEELQWNIPQRRQLFWVLCKIHLIFNGIMFWEAFGIDPHIKQDCEYTVRTFDDWIQIWQFSFRQENQPPSFPKCATAVKRIWITCQDRLKDNSITNKDPLVARNLTLRQLRIV